MGLFGFFSKRAVKALWFAETFGLVPESIAFTSSSKDGATKVVVPLLQSGAYKYHSIHTG